MPRWRDEWSGLRWYQMAVVWFVACYFAVQNELRELVSRVLTSVPGVARRSQRKFIFVTVTTLYEIRLSPIILGGLAILIMAAHPELSFEGFKAGLAGGIVWEVGKRIILG